MIKNLMGRRQREAEMKRQDRLPPGQSLTEKFPVLHYGPVPSTNLDTWTLRIFGDVIEEIVWDWETFSNLPRVSRTLDLHCVTRWSKFDTVWDGVSLGQLVHGGIIKLKPQAKYVVQHCEYGYTTNTPIELVLQDNFLLATRYDGKPLAPEHGFPLRGLVGTFTDRSETKSAYLWKGGKWLRALEFRADDQPGFWEKAGYHNEADPWKEQRFARGY